MQEKFSNWVLRALAVAWWVGVALQANPQGGDILPMVPRCLDEVDWASLEAPIVGSSAVMRKVKEQILHFARSEGTTPLMIVGETGSGKEGVARALHSLGPRSRGPYLATNCANLEFSRASADLFGHEKGAYTGADKMRPGLFERANLGSLFLDEFTSLDSTVQAALLRVLEGHPFERLGGSTLVTPNVRVIVASNVEPEICVAEKRLRTDLYYRVAMLRINLPPLREHLEDIPELVQHILRGPRFSGSATLEPGVLETLQRYRWPGNVRQLQSVLASAYIFSTDGVIRQESIQSSLAQFSRLQPEEMASAPALADALPDDLLSLEQVERFQIVRILKRTKGVKQSACRLLGIARRTLDRKIEQHRIQPAEYETN